MVEENVNLHNQIQTEDDLYEDASEYESSDDTLEDEDEDRNEDRDEDGNVQLSNAGNEKPENNQESDDESLESINQDDEFMASVEMKYKAKRSLLEFRCKVEDAILGNYILGRKPRIPSLKNEDLRDISLWGVPLLPSKSHVGTDVVLLKFLKAKDFKVSEAFDMLQKTLQWRRKYKVDDILEEKLCCDLDGVKHFSTTDKQGRPLWFFSYGGFKNSSYREQYLKKKKCSGKEEKREEFVRWRVQVMEKAIRELSFKPGGVDSIVEISDLKGLSGPATKEVRALDKRAIMLFQDYYPELIARNVVLNVPFWYFTSHRLLSGFMNQRTKKRFVLKRSCNVKKALLKCVAPQDIPFQYGGLRREDDREFRRDDKVSELVLKGNTVATINFPAKEVGVTMVWDSAVAGSEVWYKEEFVPDDEGSYRIMLKTQKRMEQSVRNSFYINEPGTIMITIDNCTYKKIRVSYRHKTKPTVPLYVRKCFR